jgi:hypothetical protein
MGYINKIVLKPVFKTFSCLEKASDMDENNLSTKIILTRKYSLSKINSIPEFPH